MSWTDDVTPAEWQEWTEFANKVSKKREKAPTSLGYEDYAAQAIEKLFSQTARPDNIEGWLTTAIKNAYIDRLRKIAARGGASIRELSDEEWEAEMITRAVGSPSAAAMAKHQVSEVLNVLNDSEKEILILSTAGFKNSDIAMHLGYGNGKIVATRIKQIYAKVQKKLQQK
jgi:RNA polymerase sigma factor (sigma-70 family)